MKRDLSRLHDWRHGRIIGMLIAGILAFASPHQAAAQPQRDSARNGPAMDGIELRPGIVIDPDRRVAYIMNPEGGIDAVELTGGRRLWTSRAAAKPLALAEGGDLLVSQAEPSGAENELTL